MLPWLRLSFGGFHKRYSIQQVACYGLSRNKLPSQCSVTWTLGKQGPIFGQLATLSCNVVAGSNNLESRCTFKCIKCCFSHQEKEVQRITIKYHKNQQDRSEIK